MTPQHSSHVRSRCLHIYSSTSHRTSHQKKGESHLHLLLSVGKPVSGWAHSIGERGIAVCRTYLLFLSALGGVRGLIEGAERRPFVFKLDR